MSVFKRPGFPNYYMKFDFEGDTIYKSCKTPVLAEARQCEIDERIRLTEESKQAKQPKKPVGPAPLLADYSRLPESEEDPGGPFWDEVIIHPPEKEKMPKTVAFYRERLKSIHLSKVLSGLRLDEIDETVLKNYIREIRRAGWDPRKNLMVVHLILKTALSSKLIVALPQFTKFPERPLIGIAVTPEEEALYMAAADQDLQDFVQLMVNTAMEPGAAAELTWTDVHFEMTRYTHGWVFDRCTKNALRTRELAMTSRLAPVLKARWLRMGRPAAGYVFPADRNGKSHHTDPGTFRCSHDRLWQETQTRVPVTIRKFRPYDFRHTALTRAVEAGLNAFELQQMAGWKTIRMADRYIHLGPQSRNRAAEKLSDYLDPQEQPAVRSARAR